ncbi:DUF5753 domain-containing protein [Streptodolium elevatio]|uniref:DUF5753 domain-containing protein n=1 Tax=Streptodolium elevatio TaxID=3157996 RepID=A0ABV3D9A8_9ACTN
MHAEERAARMRIFEPQTIPGVFQTEGYIRELFRQVGKLPHEIDAQVTARLARRATLAKLNPPSTWTVLEEGALSRLCQLPSEIAAEQVEHLLAMAELPNVTIEVVPISCGLHACMNGPIVLISIPGRGEVAYCEGMGSGRLVTDDQAVLDVECRYDLMRAEAHSPRHSVQVLSDLLEML